MRAELILDLVLATATEYRSSLMVSNSSYKGLSSTSILTVGLMLYKNTFTLLIHFYPTEAIFQGNVLGISKIYPKP